MKFLLYVCLWLCFAHTVFAQQPVFSAQFLENEPYELNSFRVLHVEPMSDSVMVALEIAMRGAIQKRSGSLMSGGGKLETLKATYIYILDKEGREIRKEIHWLKPEKAPKSFNILNDKAGRGGTEVIATEEDALSISDYQKLHLKRVLKMSDEEIAEEMDKAVVDLMEEIKAPFQALGELFEDKEFTGDDLPDKIYRTEPFMSIFGGKLKKLRCTDYTKRPNGESSLLGGRYTMGGMETYKLDMEDFFDDKNKRFTTLNHIVKDPLSGNAIVYAGVKIKKDKSEKDNKYFEHIVLTFDRKGELKNKVILKNEDAWEVGTSKLIGAKGITDLVDPAFDFVFIAQDPPSKEWVSTPNQQRFLILNAEGEIVLSEVVPSTSHRSKLLQRVSPLNDSILVVNTYAPADPHAFAGIYTLNSDKGILDQRLLQTGVQNAQAGPFIPTSSSKSIRNEIAYLAEDGSSYLLDLLYVKAKEETGMDPAQPARYYNYLFYGIKPDGRLTDVAVLERTFDNYTEAMDVELLNENEDTFILKVTERMKGESYLKMTTIQKSDMSTHSFSLPHPLLNQNSIYTGEEHTYFMVKEESGSLRLLSY